MLDQLSSTQRKVIVLRYGLRDGNELSLAKVGEQLGISREQVRRLQQEALRCLRLRRTNMRNYLVE
ncbi:MAG TPA: hypothetical protein IGR64_00320 [Leptolyngbyaceae cyanobacterium M65_K2018_010]|nr:hypothetical protein [Leptolyngbyaceae cyanobacterium M65_K2018_010]